MPKILVPSVVLALVAVALLTATSPATATGTVTTMLATGDNHISQTLQAGETWVWQVPPGVNGHLDFNGGFTSGDKFDGTPIVNVDGQVWNIAWTCGPSGATTICSLQQLTSTKVHGGSQVTVSIPGSSAHYVEVKLRLLYDVFLPIMFKR